MVVSGAKQGLSLVARAMLGQGDVAVIESPTFVGMLESVRMSGARVIGIPADEDGLDVDMLERLLGRHEIKLVALQTACQNPTGRNLTEERRRRLAELAIERNFFILEDRVYADAAFEGEPVSADPRARARPRDLRQLAVEGGRRRPAAGWVAARGPVRDRIARLKLANDFHTATLIQYIAARWLAHGRYDEFVRETLPFYRERRDALMKALERHLRASTSRTFHRAGTTSG